MASKCVHKGCGKVFSDQSEPCTYHPGPPEFHEGTKGWKCCKPRVLTFDEFLSIPPCTTGTHTTVDDTPTPAPKPTVPDDTPSVGPIPQSQAQAAPQATAAPAAPEPESEDDAPSIPIPVKKTCRRRKCEVESTEATVKGDRSGEKCVFHPGHPVFHEGNKGWSCCKKRVQDFDEFMGIEGCKTVDRHMFVGSGKKAKKGGAGGAGAGDGSATETLLEKAQVRHDFYQTPSSVHASLFLKKIAKEQASVVFGETEVKVDLPTADGTRYRDTIPLFGAIDIEKSKFRVLGTKLELTLAKADGRGWSVLRADERPTGEIIQSGKAGRA